MRSGRFDHNNFYKLFNEFLIMKGRSWYFVLNGNEGEENYLFKGIRKKSLASKTAVRRSEML